MFNEQKAAESLKAGYIEAEKVLNDKDKLEELLQRVEQKLKKIRTIGMLLKRI